MLAMLSFLFTSMAEDSTVLDPAEQQQVAEALEDDAQIVSNTQLDELLPTLRRKKNRNHSDQYGCQAKIIAIRTDRPLLAGIGGLLLSLRMVRLPDIEVVPGRETVLGA